MMDCPHLNYVTQPDSEALLLLANIYSAMRELEAAKPANGSADTVRVLELALSTYGSIKHLVPKLKLSREQQALVEEHLQLLRARIMASDPALTAGGY